MDRLRNETLTAEPHDWIEGFECYFEMLSTVSIKIGLRALREERPKPISLSDIEFLGKGIYNCALKLHNIQIIEALYSYAKLKVSKPEWIEHLAIQIKPTELEFNYKLVFLEALSSLQRSHQKSILSDSMFTATRFPSFMEKTPMAPLFENQTQLVEKIVEAIKYKNGFKKLTSMDISVIVYCLGQLAPKEPFGVDTARRLMTTLIETYPNNDALDIDSKIVLLYSWGKFETSDNEIQSFLVDRLFENPKALNHLHLGVYSMLLYSLARMKFRDRIRIRELVKAGIGGTRLTRFSAWDLSTLFYSLSKFDLGESEEILLELGKEVVRSRRLATFTEQGLAVLVYALGMIKFREMDLVQKVLEEVLKPGRIEFLTYRGLCMMLHGLSKLPYEQRLAIRDQTQMLTNMLAEFSRMKTPSLEERFPKEIVSFLFGCTLCRSVLKDFEIQNILTEFSKRLGALKSRFLKPLYPKEILIMIKSLSKLDFKDSKAWKSILNHVASLKSSRSLDKTMAADLAFRFTHPTVSSTSQTSSTIQNLLIDVLDPTQLSKMTDTELVTVLQTVQSTGHSQTSLDFVYNEILKPERMRRFGEHHRVLVLTQALQSSQDHFPKDEILQRLQNSISLSKLDHQGLVTLLYQFSKHRPKDAFLDELLEQIRSQSGFVKTLKEDSVSMLANAYANLNIRDKRLIVPLLTELAVPGRLKAMSDKGLVLLLNACSKLGSRPTVWILSIVQELKRRPIVNLSLDLISMTMQTMGKCGIYDTMLFDQAIAKLETSDLESMETLAIVHILDALSRLRITQKTLMQRMYQIAIAKASELNLTELHLLFHSIGRTQFQDERIQDFIRTFVQSPQFHVMDEAAMSGLIFAATEIEVTDSETSDRILKKALDPSFVLRYKEGHLCNIMYRLHAFNPTNDAHHLLISFAEAMDKKIHSGAISLGKLGQIIMGAGKLAQKNPRPAFLNILKTTCSKQILDQMTTEELVGQIVASSVCPVASIPFARKTAAYMITKGTLYTCTKAEIATLQKALAKFDGGLHDLNRSLNLLLSVWEKNSLVYND